MCSTWSSAAFRRLTATEAAEQAASFSPDGGRVAFVRGHDLFAVDLADGAETRLTGDGSGTVRNGTLSWVYWEEIFGRRDIGYWWSPDSRALAFLQSDESAVAEAVFPDFRPWVPAVRRQRYPKAGTANPAVRVGVVAATGGAPVWVALDAERAEYVARVGWLPDSRRLAVQTMTRDQRSLDLGFACRRCACTGPTARWARCCRRRGPSCSSRSTCATPSSAPCRRATASPCRCSCCGRAATRPASATR